MSADTVGGVWRYALDLAAGLDTHDVEVHLVTMGAPVSPAGDSANRSVRFDPRLFRDQRGMKISLSGASRPTESR